MVCVRVCLVWWMAGGLSQGSLHVIAIEQQLKLHNRQQASYEDLARTNAEVLRKVTELGGQQVGVGA